MPQQGAQLTVDTLSWKVNSVDTKTRINEQNIMNERRHVQLVNKNLLSLKKELRDRVGQISRDSSDIKKKLQELEAKVTKLEETVKRGVPKKRERPKLDIFKSELSGEDADAVLDNLIKGKAGK